jgi:hypothetical protein
MNHALTDLRIPRPKQSLSHATNAKQRPPIEDTP